MPRISPYIFYVTILTLTTLFSPIIPFYVQLYFLSKDSHSDVDMFVHEKYRKDIHAYFLENQTFEVNPIMTLQQFLTHHNFNLYTTQEQAFYTIDAWSKSTCFVPSAVVHSFQKSKKRDDRLATSSIKLDIS